MHDQGLLAQLVGSCELRAIEFSRHCLLPPTTDHWHPSNKHSSVAREGTAVAMVMDAKQWEVINTMEELLPVLACSPEGLHCTQPAWGK